MITGRERKSDLLLISAWIKRSELWGVDLRSWAVDMVIYWPSA